MVLEVSDPLLPQFLSSKMGMIRVPGASCLTFICLSFLIYKVEMMMALNLQGSWKDEIHKVIRAVPGKYKALDECDTV